MAVSLLNEINHIQIARRFQRLSDLRGGEELLHSPVFQILEVNCRVVMSTICVQLKDRRSYLVGVKYELQFVILSAS